VDLLREAEGLAVIRGFREPIDLAARSGRVRRTRLRPRKTKGGLALGSARLCICPEGARCSGGGGSGRSSEDFLGPGRIEDGTHAESG